MFSLKGLSLLEQVTKLQVIEEQLPPASKSLELPAISSTAAETNILSGLSYGHFLSRNSSKTTARTALGVSDTHT